MVSMGIKGYNDGGLQSVAWTDQKPVSLDGFFAGASNIIFVFGEYRGVGGWQAGRWWWVETSSHSCRARIPDALLPSTPPPLYTGGHAMLLEVMDAMFRPFKFHKVFYCRCSTQTTKALHAWMRLCLFAHGLLPTHCSLDPQRTLSYCVQLPVRVHPGAAQLHVHLLGLAGAGS
jgi:hypothetical protein